jgi:filamentous hemagglutinin family protein
VAEELPASHGRLYANKKLGFIEPGLIRNDGIHNVFKDIRLKKGGLILKGGSQDRPIFNRVHQDKPILLDGVIQAEKPCPVVFGNYGGVYVKNADFKNIEHLTLAAGNLALTNKGMAYSVDHGEVCVSRTVLLEDSGVKKLSLSGEEVHLNNSILNPTDSLEVVTGKHIRGFWQHHSVCVFDREPQALVKSITTNNDSVLRSKAIFLESLDKEASIHLLGCIESTDEDIVIRARGDIYINKLVAHGNLDIQTTGKVYFGKEAHVGGSVRVIGGQIFVENELSAVGKLYLESEESVVVNGALFSRDNDVGVKAKKLIDVQGLIAAKKDISFDSPDTQNKGQVISNGYLDFTGQFKNTENGSVKVESIINPISFFTANEGLVELKDSLCLLGDLKSSLKGTVITHGKFKYAGNTLNLEGKLFAVKGAVFEEGFDSFTNKGELLAYGKGLKGRMSQLHNHGKIDVSNLNAQIEHTRNESGAVLRTQGNFNVEGKSYNNSGTVFTCGVHKLSLDETFIDNGTFYSPTLFILKAKDIEYGSAQTSYLRDASIESKATLNVAEGAKFNFPTKNERGFENKFYLSLKNSALKSTSKSSPFKFSGKITQKSNEKFPLRDFFELFDEKIDTANFKSLTDFIQGLSIELKKKTEEEKSKIQFISTKNIELKNVKINPTAASLDIIVEGKYQDTGSVLKTGVFSGYNVNVNAKSVNLKNTLIESRFGSTSAQALEEISLSNSHLLAGIQASVRASILNMNDSSIKQVGQNGQGTRVEVDKLSATNSKVGSESGVNNLKVDRSAHIKYSTMEGKANLITVGESLVLSRCSLISDYNRIQGNKAELDNNEFTGRTDVAVNDLAKLQGNKAHDLLTVKGEKIRFIESNQAKSLFAQGKHIENTGTLNTDGNLSLEGEVIAQFGKTQAGTDSYIKAKQRYDDKETSHNFAKGNLVLSAPENNGFKGSLKAARIDIELKDMNLLKLLNQTDCSELNAVLKEGEVVIDSDLIINRTLGLWAKKFENSKSLTAQGDFQVHVQNTILNTGHMMIYGKGIFEGDSTEIKSGTIEADDISFKVRHFYMERLKRRVFTTNGFKDELLAETKIKARKGNVNIKASESVNIVAGEIEARQGITLDSDGFLFIGAQELQEEQRTQTKKSSYFYQNVKQEVAKLNAEKADINLKSKDKMVFAGVESKSGGHTTATSEKTIECIAQMESERSESSSEKSGGLLGKKSKKNREETRTKVIPNFFKAGGNVTFDAKEDNYQQATKIECDGKAKFISREGKVFLASATEVEMFHLQKSSSNAVWQSSLDKGHVHENVVMCNIKAKGGFEVSGAEGVEAEIKKSFDRLAQDPGTTWVKELRQNSTVKFKEIEEEHRTWSKKQSGLTAVGALLVSLIVTIATAGAGLAAAVGNAVTQACGTGAFGAFLSGAAVGATNSLITSGSISLINNRGNISKTFQDLMSSKQLKALAVAALASGIVQGASAHFDLPQTPEGLYQHAQHQLLKNSVNASLSVVFDKEDPEKAFLNALKNGVVSALGGWAANQIAAAYKPANSEQPTIDAVTHKFLHAIVGAGLGAATGKNAKKGAFAGAVGAFSAELFAEALPDSMHPDMRAHLAQLGVGLAGLFSRFDVNAALFGADNALENNFKRSHGAVEKGGGEEEDNEDQGHYFDIPDLEEMFYESLEEHRDATSKEGSNGGIWDWFWTESETTAEGKKQVLNGMAQTGLKFEQELNKPNLSLFDKMGLYFATADNNRAIMHVQQFSDAPGAIALDVAGLIPCAKLGGIFKNVKFGSKVSKGGKNSLAALDLASVNKLPGSRSWNKNITPFKWARSPGFHLGDHYFDRKFQRSIPSVNILPALNAPLKKSKLRYIKENKPNERWSQKYIGLTTTVVINPVTKKIITVYKTPSNVVKKLLKEKINNK